MHLLALLSAFAVIGFAGAPALGAPADEKLKARVVTQLGHVVQVESVAFSPDGRFVLSGSSDHAIKLWDVATGREMRSFAGHTGGVHSVAFSPDGRLALSGSW